MFNRKPNPAAQPAASPAERVTSVLGAGITWRGALTGSGGVRIEGALDGDVNLRGLFVVGESGRVQANTIRANIVIVAGLVHANITAEKLEIRATGRVWGNVVTAAFATEEGAFLRGQIRMEDQIELGPLPAPEISATSEEDAGGD